MNDRPDWRGTARRAFLDSAAYFALADQRELNHRRAQAIAAGLRDRHWRVFMTNFVVAEAHALMLTRLGRVWAAALLQEVEQSRATVVVRARETDERRAKEIIARYDDKDFSLTDAISFAVMERLNIPFAFTFYQHFAQYGWTVLTPAHF